MAPLSLWRHTPLKWRWFQDRDHIVWEQDGEHQWKKYEALPTSRRRTRHTVHRYQEGVYADEPSKDSLYPATIESYSEGVFTVSVSAHRFQDMEPAPPPNLWRHASVPTALANTPPFFQHLISTPPTEQECHDIAAEIEEKTLVACSDGACDTIQAVSSYATVFASGLLRRKITSAVGPVDGHPSLVTSYRAEMSGILATLYLVYRICDYYKVTEGAMTLYCDNRGALKNAFSPIKAGITPYFNTDHDLVEVAQALLLLIPVAISTSWVKGHYTGADRQYQHDLNDEADKLAGQYQGWQVPHHTIRQPLPPPNYSIRLLHDSSVLTSRIRSTVVDSLHSGPIESHIMRKANWSPQVFRKVHWDAHERAFRRLHRYAQHSTAKLVHGLVNTNRQNHLYYGHSSLCPICNSEEETLSHVFSCAAPAAANHRLKSLEDLRKTLISILTSEVQMQFSPPPSTSSSEI